MRVVIFTLIGIIVFLGAVSFINKNDKENRIDVNKKGIIALIITLSTTLIYIKYKANVEFYVYFYLSIYLIIVGYIDYKTKNVYSIFNWLTIMIGIWFLIYQKSIYDFKSVLYYSIFSIFSNTYKIKTHS